MRVRNAQGEIIYILNDIHKAYLASQTVIGVLKCSGVG